MVSTSSNTGNLIALYFVGMEKQVHPSMSNSTASLQTFLESKVLKVYPFVYKSKVINKACLISKRHTPE